MLTQDELKSLLSYNRRTGVFKWRVSPCGNVKRWSVAGSLNEEGYRFIDIRGRTYRAHRLAWFYVTGKWPVEHLDHKNCDHDDNRFTNLREASLAQNNQNRVRPNTGNSSGVLGVSWDIRRQRWRAQIWVEGRSRSLGHFKHKTEARRAYLAAKRELHPFFAGV